MRKETALYKRRANGDMVLMARRYGEEAEQATMLLAAKIAEDGGVAIIECFDVDDSTETLNYSMTFDPEQ